MLGEKTKNKPSKHFFFLFWNQPVIINDNDVDDDNRPKTEFVVVCLFVFLDLFSFRLSSWMDIRYDRKKERRREKEETCVGCNQKKNRILNEKERKSKWCPPMYFLYLARFSISCPEWKRKKEKNKFKTFGELANSLQLASYLTLSIHSHSLYVPWMFFPPLFSAEKKAITNRYLLLLLKWWWYLSIYLSIYLSVCI